VSKVSGSGVLKYYDDSPWRVRLHVHGRWRLCPFRSLVTYLPDEGRLVDVGSGYGLWPFYVHTLKPDMEIWGLEPDPWKVQVATAIARKWAIETISFAQANAQGIDLPACRAATIIDVLYLIPWEEQIEVLAKLVRALEPGGTLLIKEMSEQPSWKYAWNWFEEWLAVRIIKITQGNRFYFRKIEDWLSLLNSLGLDSKAIRVDRGYIYPHVLFVGQKKP